MKLRITDTRMSDSAKNGIEITFQDADYSQSFSIESYDSPISTNLRDNIKWYFEEYPTATHTNTKNDKQISEKMILAGQHIGDQLLGEDHQLINITNKIEQKGYSSLDVVIESNDPVFFDEPWELLILPESKYVLSSACKTFCRQFLSSHTEYSKRHEQLSVSSLTAESISKAIPGHIASDIDIGSDQPLRILHIVTDDSLLESNAFELSLELLTTENAIDYELFPFNSWEELQQRIKDKKRPINIIHYSGSISIVNGLPNFLVNDIESSNFTQWITSFIEHNVTLLSLDIKHYYNYDNDTIAHAIGLAQLAKKADELGLGNIVGLNQKVDKEIAASCYKLLYQKVISSLSLAQSIVEARKFLQAQLQLTTLTPLPFSVWPLITHYGKQEIYYFSKEHVVVDLENSQYLNKIKSSLFGFRDELFPPRLINVSEKNLLELVAYQLKQKACVIKGESGSGKTHLLHLISFYLQHKQIVDYSFYFDFNEHSYRRDDLIEMIAPILNLDSNDYDSAISSLSAHKCCFVFDNLMAIADVYQYQDSTAWAELSSFISELHDAGHSLFMSGYSSDNNETTSNYLLSFESSNITVDLLTIRQELALAIESARNTDITEIELTTFLQDCAESLQRNPFLVKAVTPLVAKGIIKNPKKILVQEISKNKTLTIRDNFYQWQWSSLSPMWQSVLQECKDTEGLILEMVMIVFDDPNIFPAVKNWLTAFNKNNTETNFSNETFSNAIKVWKQAGYVKELPFGHIIDREAKPFLNREAKSEALLNEKEKQQIDIYFSQIICEGICRLVQIISEKPNPVITHQLLANRRTWVKHFETLWFAGCYKEFIHGKKVFDRLLQESQLQNESIMWTFDLFKRSQKLTVANTSSYSIAWLTLAEQSLLDQNAEKEPLVLSGIACWHEWLCNTDETTIGTPQENQDIFITIDKALLFLKAFYQKTENWQAAITICQVGYRVYKRISAWMLLIESLRSLSLYHSKLKQLDLALDYENKIIEDIPYDEAPPRFKIQLFIEIILARLARGQINMAKALYEQVMSLNESREFGDVLTNIHADILFFQEEYLSALPLYCSMWSKAVNLEQQAHLEPLKIKLAAIEKHIGSENFGDLFKELTGDEYIGQEHHENIIN